MNNNKYQFAVSDIQDVSTEFSDEFAIARINVLSTKPNSHKINITDEVLRKSGDTLRGKWVIAEYDKYRRDVTSHTPNTHIIGIIPQDAQIDYVVDEDGDTTMVVDAVISKLYATEVYNLFKDKNFRAVSVEMGVENERPSQLGDGSTDIDGINYYSVCVLGKSVNGSCPNANMEIIKFSDEKAAEYYDTIYTKEKALKLSDELRKFAQSLESKDNNDVKETEMAKVEEFAKDVKDEKDVVMSEENNEAKESESEESKEMADPNGEAKTEDEEKKEMSEESNESDEDDKDDDKEDDGDEKDMSCGGDKEMGCGEKDMGCGDGEKEFEEQPKEFSLEQFVSKEIIENLSEAQTELVKMSADDIVKKFAEIMAENAELKEFKAQSIEADRQEKVNAILAEVKDDLDPKQFEELAEQSKEVTYEGLSAFSNQVKAFAYEASKNKPKTEVEDNGVTLMASADTSKVEDEGDVFSRLKKKFNV